MMLFLGYANEISVESSLKMIQYILGHIIPLMPETIRVQKDNSVEFLEITRKIEHNRFSFAFNECGCSRRCIPPGHCNANAESYISFHHLQRPNWSKKKQKRQG